MPGHYQRKIKVKIETRFFVASNRGVTCQQIFEYLFDTDENHPF